MSMASAAAATVIVEPVSRVAARGSDTHSTVAVGGGTDVSDIPKIAAEQSSAAIRDGMPGTLSSEPRRKMSSTTTRVSPKHGDAWPTQATAVTGASAFMRPDTMADRS